MLKTLTTACLIFLSVGIAQAAESPSGSWSKPAQLTEGPVTWINSAKDSQGNVIAVWAVDGKLQVAYCKAGKSWPGGCQTCQLAVGVEGYSVAMDPSGFPMVVWSIVEKGSFKIYSAIWPKGAPFWVPFGVMANVQGETDGAYPSVGFDGEGNAIAGWLNHSNGTYLYQSARFSSAHWTRCEDLTVPEDMNFPELRVSQNGTAILAWLGNGEIHASRLAKNSKSWSTPATLSEGFFPSVGIDKDGNALILWASTHKAKAARGAFLATTSDTWEKLNMPPESNGVDGWFLLDMNSAGQAAVAWEGYLKEKRSYIRTTQFSTQTKSWSPVTTLHRGPYHSNYYYPKVAIDESGNVLCSWVVTRKGVTQLFWATCPQGGDWSVPLSLGIADKFYPNPLLTNGGKGTLLYLYKEGIQALNGTELFPN